MIIAYLETIFIKSCHVLESQNVISAIICYKPLMGVDEKLYSL